MATLTLSGAEANSIIRNQYSLKDTDCVSILSSQNAESQDIIGCIRSGQKLQAIKIISATVNFASTANYVDGSGYPIENGAFFKAVSALQALAEIYYVGIPTASGANQFIALVNANKTDSGNGYGASTSADGSYENLEDAIGAAIGTAENDITITNVTLTGLSFA